jgi:hypothetical protein
MKWLPSYGLLLLLILLLLFFRPVLMLGNSSLRQTVEQYNKKVGGVLHTVKKRRDIRDGCISQIASCLLPSQKLDLARKRVFFNKNWILAVSEQLSIYLSSLCTIKKIGEGFSPSVFHYRQHICISVFRI